MKTLMSVPHRLSFWLNPNVSLLRKAALHAMIGCMICMNISALADDGLVRDSRVVVVDGRSEVWKLVWTEAPQPVCPAPSVATTCPCVGIGYGEYGHLNLVREWQGQVIERLDIGAIASDDGGFDEPNQSSPGAISVQYADPGNNIEDDIGLESKNQWNALSWRSRPKTDLLNMADWTKDGAATTFLMLAGTRPCAALRYMAFGTTKSDPRLHVIRSADPPFAPLSLPIEAWRSIRAGRKASLEVWACGDHGSDELEELTVEPLGDAAIRVTDRKFTCTADGKRGALLGIRSQYP